MCLADTSSYKDLSAASRFGSRVTLLEDEDIA
jgi:hypothetical protein